jgi:hypothetical protein
MREVEASGLKDADDLANAALGRKGSLLSRLAARKDAGSDLTIAGFAPGSLMDREARRKRSTRRCR